MTENVLDFPSKETDDTFIEHSENKGSINDTKIEPILWCFMEITPEFPLLGWSYMD